MAKGPKHSDIKHVIPAMQPAWIRIVERYEFDNDDGTKRKEWQDVVLPVLAYATLDAGIGAYLIVDPDSAEGTCWVTGRAPEGVVWSDCRIIHALQQEPTRGCQIKGFTDDYKYFDQPLTEIFDSVWFIL